jgi:ketosteroid isomerase-like protein
MPEESTTPDEHLAAMRRIVHAINRKDYEAVLADLDDAVEIDDTDIPETTGGDSFLAWVTRWDQAWDGWHVEDVDIRAAEDDQAIALFTMVAKGRGSGVELRRADALVASFRGGKAVKLGYYNDQAQALEAVGLAE